MSDSYFELSEVGLEEDSRQQVSLSVFDSGKRDHIRYE